jgi:anti-anti-sigma factor
MFSLQTGSDQERGRMAASGELTIYHAAELHQSIAARLAGCKTIELDLSQVSEIDTAGVQTLLVAMRSAEAAGGSLRLTNCAGGVIEVMRALHLADVLVAEAAVAAC